MNVRQKEFQYVLLNEILEFSKDIHRLIALQVKSEDIPTIENFKNIRARM